MTEKDAIRIIDDMLCGEGWHGEDLAKYANTWLEIYVTEEQAEALEVFHNMAKSSKAGAVG